MKKFNFVVISGILLGLTLGIAIFTPIVVEAIGDVSLENPLGTTNISEILGSIVKKLLTILGSISLLVLVAGGFLWLTSAGNAEKVKLGTNTMLYAIIGLFIIFSSYAILNTVIDGLTGGKIASQSSGATESSETTGGKDTKTPLEKANEICKSKNSEFSCVNIVNCEGVPKKDTQTAKDACAAAGDKCINGACPGVADDIKCCKPTAPATQTTSGSSTGDSCGGAEHPTWSCMNILNCNINLTGKSSVSQQRAVCKDTPDKCVTGKCSGEDNIVCCDPVRGSCFEPGSCKDNISITSCSTVEKGGFSKDKMCYERGLNSEGEQIKVAVCRSKAVTLICNSRSQIDCAKDKLCTYSGGMCSWAVTGVGVSDAAKKIEEDCKAMGLQKCEENKNCVLDKN